VVGRCHHLLGASLVCCAISINVRTWGIDGGIQHPFKFE
jgi:hypothetical protein